jgi:hypothetical protein
MISNRRYLLPTNSGAPSNVLDSIDRHSTVRLLPFATDATASVQLTKGGYNNGTKTFIQTVIRHKDLYSDRNNKERRYDSNKRAGDAGS